MPETVDVWLDEWKYLGPGQMQGENRQHEVMFLMQQQEVETFLYRWFWGGRLEALRQLTLAEREEQDLHPRHAVYDYERVLCWWRKAMYLWVGDKALTGKPSEQVEVTVRNWWPREEAS